MISSLSEEPGADSWPKPIWPWLAVFVFLLPISLNVGGLGISANYSFLALLLFLPSVRSWPKWILTMAVYGGVCYLYAVWFAANDGPNSYLRQFVSFSLFVGTLLIAAVRMPFDFALLARITVLISACYSLLVGVVLIAKGPHIITNAGMSKAMLGEWVPDWPQRFIIVVMLAFFLALYLGRQAKRWVFAAGLCGFCLVASHGLAGYFSMLASLALLTLLYLHGRDWAGLRALIYAVALSFLLVAAFAGVGNGFLGGIVERLSDVDHLILESSISLRASPQGSGISLSATPQDTRAMIASLYAEGGEASGKIRLAIWSDLLHKMINEQMWLGSGFAGPYLFDAAIGSAHSQYVDILFRTGPLGLILYVGLWGVLLRRGFKYSMELGCALLAWFVYGFFHETTKYSYGAFLFFTLLSFAWFGWGRAGTDSWERGRS